MKTLIKLSLVIAMAVGMAGCGKSPESTAEKFVKCVFLDGDVKSAEKYVKNPESGMSKFLVIDPLKEYVDRKWRKGAFDKVEFAGIERTTYESDNSATVTLKVLDASYRRSIEVKLSQVGSSDNWQVSGLGDWSDFDR